MLASHGLALQSPLAFQDDRSYSHAMARPRRSDKTRERLLEEGVRLFSHVGFHGTGLKAILDKVGVPKGSFYNYFASKDAFVEEVARKYIATLLGAYDRVIAGSSQGALSTLRTMLGFMVDMLEGRFGPGCLLGNLAGEIGSSHPQQREVLLECFNLWLARLERHIAAAQEEGSVRKDLPAKELAEYFWNAWEGSLLAMKMQQSTAPVRQCLELTFDVFFPPAKP